jgi:hypothetical protein
MQHQKRHIKNVRFQKKFDFQKKNKKNEDWESIEISCCEKRRNLQEKNRYLQI